MIGKYYFYWSDFKVGFDEMVLKIDESLDFGEVGLELF